MQKLSTQNVKPEILQAIDNVFAIFGVEREPLMVETVGDFAVTNPGSKDINTAVEKLDRKFRSPEEARLNLNTEIVLDNHISGKEGDAFDKISDWARCSVIVPNFAEALPVMSTLVADFGGVIDVHDRADYKAFHLHTNIKSINAEIQIHTVETAMLKQGTDIFYHKYRDIPVPKNSEVEKQYNAEYDAMLAECQTVYNASDFDAHKQAMQDLAQAYNNKSKGKIKGKNKLSHFLQIIKKSEIVQEELFTRTQQVLADYNQVKDIALDLNK